MCILHPLLHFSFSLHPIIVLFAPVPRSLSQASRTKMGYKELLLCGIFLFSNLVSAFEVRGASDARSIFFLETSTSFSLAMPYGPEWSHRHRVKRQSHPVINSATYYHGCGITKRCIPEHCVDLRNCSPYLATWTMPRNKSVEYMEFNLIAQHVDTEDSKTVKACSSPASRRYVAIGFAVGSVKKSKIAVIECSKSKASDDSKVTLGWSSKKYYKHYDPTYNCDLNTMSGHLTKCSVELDSNENIVCQFYLKKRVVWKNEIYDFPTSEFFVHLTSGCDVDDLQKGFFNGGNPYSPSLMIHFHRLLQSTNDILQSYLSKLHGALMIVAWCFFIPNGMFFSRYFKESFVGISICQLRFWFAGHISVQLLGFIAFLAAHAMSIERRRSTETKFAWPSNPSLILHYRLGIAASLMLIGQVFGGWFRFSGRKARRTFAFLHMVNGVLSYIISLINIGLSYDLGMPCKVQGYVGALAGCNLFCHAVMTLHFYYLDKSLGLYINRALYPFTIPPVTYEELPGKKVRLMILIAHFVGTLILCGLLLIQYFMIQGCKCTRDFCRDKGI